MTAPNRGVRHGGPAGQRRALGTCLALHPQRRLARAQRCLARRAAGRDPRRRGAERQREDDAAALPGRDEPGPRGRGVVQQRTRAHPRPAGPRTAAPGPVRLDRPRPRPRAGAERLGEHRPAADAARHRPAPRQGHRPGVAGAPGRRRPGPQTSAPAAPVRAAAGLHRPRPRPRPHRALRRRADRPAAPGRPRSHPAHPDHRGPLARHHGRPGHPRRGDRGARRPHGGTARRTVRQDRPAPPTDDSTEGRTACSLSV